MPLIRNGALVADGWVAVADGEAVPDGEHAIVGFARWQAERDAFAGRNARIGIRLANTDDVQALAEDIARIGLIALEFPKFNDGRAYSQARLLRERLGFTGELRATGQVLRDQYPFMRRCGFDAFEVSEGTTVEAFRKSEAMITRCYQPAGDDAPTIGSLRAGGAPRAPVARTAS
jgi:uncharacterized protein (DUF934 family)